VRTARELQQHPITAVDLNLGCPAPVVYRKCAGGGLLRDLDRVDTILGALREAVHVKLTVKTRIGFEDERHFEQLLSLFARHRVDLVTVHGRTVKEMYRSAVRHDLIARAAAALPCPVLANGNVHSARNAAWVLEQTGVRGLMIGRGAIRNPWLFLQIRQHLAGEALFMPRGRDVLHYVHALFGAVLPPALPERGKVQKMKRYMNFIALGIDPTGEFLHLVRRVSTRAEFFDLCARFLDHDEPMPLEPFPLTLKSCDVLAGEHC
jgi:tRNA-dihydrouridine synthase